MRSAKHPGHSFNMMEQIHLHCGNDHLCHQLCLKMTSLEDEFKYSMSAKSSESTVIRWRVMRIVNGKAFRIQKIGSTGMATRMIPMTAKMIPRQTLNLTWSLTMASRI